MSKGTFKKPPLSQEEKEKKAEEFIGFLETKITPQIDKLTEKKLEKEAMKPFLLRIPSTLYDDLREITALTGISINAICLELLRPCIKKKIKELKDFE